MGGNKTPAADTPSIASLLMAQDPARLQVLMTTLALANTESQALLSEVLTGSGPLGTVTQGDPMGAGDAFGQVGMSLARNPMALMQANMDLMEAMRQTVNKHYPSYPVCNAGGVLIGIVRGSRIFEQQAIEISAQAGSMVGVEKEERAATPLLTSLKFRHPWLQFNLLTAFVAAAVVGLFEDTIARITVLAVFLPVLAGQSGNTGCQAMAVALRGLTLGELKPGQGHLFLVKEAALGLANGMLVGLTAGAGMLLYATMQGTAEPPFQLAAIVFLAMTFSCFLSGVSGVMVPLTLKKLGFDPATASSIFLTTATDVASMGFFLGIATLWLG